MKIRKLVYLVALSLIAIFVVAAGCSKSASTTTATTTKPVTTTSAATSTTTTIKIPTGDPVNIGFQIELTSSAALVASSTRTGALLAVDEINAAGGVLGRPLKLLVEDNQAKADQSALIAQKFVDQKVAAMMGTAFSADALAVIPVAQAAKIPFIVTGGASNKITMPAQPFVYQVVMNDGELAMAWLAGAQKLGFKKVGVYYTNISWGMDTNAAIAGAAASYGITVAASTSVASGATDATVQVGQLKAQGVEVIMSAAYTNENAVLFNALNALNWKVPVIGTYGLVPPNKSAIEGSYWSVYTDTSRPEVQALNSLALTKFGESAFDPWMGNMEQGYDAVKLIAWAINKANSLDGTAINNALETVKGFPGLVGTAGFTFAFSSTDHRGLKGANVVFVKIQGGKPVPVDLK